MSARVHKQGRATKHRTPTGRLFVRNEELRKSPPRRVLRILMVTGGYPPESIGGGEQQCRKLAIQLARHHYQVSIVTSCRDRALAGNRMEDGVEVIRLRARHSPQSLGRHALGAVEWTMRLLKWWGRNRDHFDVVHCHQAKYPAVVAATLGSRAGKPVLAKVGDSDEKFDLATVERKRGVGKILLRLLTNGTSVFVAISEAIASDLRRYGISDDRVRRIPNGVAVASMPPTRADRESARDALGIPFGDRTLVYAGRLAKEKNLHSLIEAFGLLPISSDRAPALRLILVGDGPERDSLAVLAKATIHPVELVGSVDDITTYLLAADFAVLPSLAEGLSNFLLEAMAVGTVPIVSPVGGNLDAVADGTTGIIAGATSVPALLEAMKRAITASDADLGKMAARAHGTAFGRYSIAAIAAAYEDLYVELVRAAAV